MDKVKFYVGLIFANAISKALRLTTGSQATSFPGLVALKLCPDFITYSQKYCNKSILTVTGTNGKTTTAGLISHILKTNKNTVLNNEKGANMLSGIASVLAQRTKPFRRNDYYVLESDEAYLTRLYDYMKADYLLVTNLFRDQLDRYGELNTTASKIQNAIDKNKDLKLFVNVDDPMLSGLGENNEKIYFGFENIEIMLENTDIKCVEEAVYCKCGAPLKYDKRFYSHVGHYYCDCGFRRQEPKYRATAKIYDDYSEVTVNDEYNFKLPLPGIYNAYNALGAISVALELQVPADTIQKAFDTYKSVFGRAERLVLKGKNTFVQLIKNPVGATEVLRTVSKKQKANLLIMINDNYADGRDISWLWDTNFELLQDFEGQIFVGGKRALDMATRLKYAGIKKEKVTIIHNIEDAILAGIKSVQTDETLLVLPTYTALLKMQKIIQDL